MIPPNLIIPPRQNARSQDSREMQDTMASKNMWGTGFTLAGNGAHGHGHRDRSKKHARRRSSALAEASPVDSPVHTPSSAAGSSFHLPLFNRGLLSPPPAPVRTSHTSSGDHGLGQGAVNFYNTAASSSEDGNFEAEEGSSLGVQVCREVRDNFERLEVLAHRPPRLMSLQADALPSSPSPVSTPASAPALLEESLEIRRKSLSPPPRVARALSSDSFASTASSIGSPREPRVLSVTPVNAKGGSRPSTPSSPPEPQPLLVQHALRPPPLQMMGLLPSSPSSSFESFPDMDSKTSERDDTAVVDRRASMPLIFNSRPHLSPDKSPSSPPIVCSRAMAAESSLNGSPRSCPRTPRVLSVTPVNNRRRSFRSLDFSCSSRGSLESSSLSPPTLGSPSHSDLIFV